MKNVKIIRQIIQDWKQVNAHKLLHGAAI